MGGSKAGVALVALGLSLAAAGCDMLGGLDRSAPLSSRPDEACVQRAVASIPGVEIVPREVAQAHTKAESNASDSVFGLDYLEKTSGRRVYLSLRDFDRHGVKSSQIWLGQGMIWWLFEGGPQGVLDAARPKMVAIEDEIERSCGVAVIRGSIDEQCSIDVKCTAVGKSG